jgi:hypothetical protein
MINEFEPGWFKGSYILVEDQGPVSKGARTKVFRVTAAGQLLGHVKWQKFWRKYAFYTNNIILEEECMADLSEFLKMKTAEQREDWKMKKSIVDWELVKSFEDTHVEG